MICIKVYLKRVKIMSKLICNDGYWKNDIVYNIIFVLFKKKD